MADCRHLALLEKGRKEEKIPPHRFTKEEIRIRRKIRWLLAFGGEFLGNEWVNNPKKGRGHFIIKVRDGIKCRTFRSDIALPATSPFHA